MRSKSSKITSALLALGMVLCLPSASGAFAPTPEAAASPVRAIVFDVTRCDIASPDASDPGVRFDSQETFRLTLYETSPDVFEGEAKGSFFFATSSDTLDEYSETYYRTERVRLTPGVGEDITLLYAVQGSHASLEWSEAPALGKMTRHNRFFLYEDFVWRLEIENDTAKLYFSADDTEPYVGQLTMLPPPEETLFQGLPAGQAISINSDGRQPQGKTNGHEYRGILTAKPSGSGFVGNLFIYGDGPGVPFCDEDVRFIMEAFDAKVYKGAGGLQPISADAMGIIHATVGDFIVLLDGERVFLEVPGSNLLIMGKLIPEGDVEQAKYIADETKPIVKTLYDGTNEKTPGSFVEDGTPTWYPAWLMPKPIKPSGQRYSTVVDTGGFNFYSIEYNENLEISYAATIKIIENYKEQLQGADDLEAIYDEESHFGIVRFNKGAYSIHILVDPPFPTNNITIRIIY